MRVAALRERIEGERRVAITPESAKQLVDAGLTVTIEQTAGIESGYADEAYRAAGAEVVAAVPLGTVDVLAHVRPLSLETIGLLKAGTVTVGLASAASELAAVRALRDARVSSCRVSPARSPWTRSPRSRWSPATAVCWRQASASPGSSRCT